MDYDKNSQEINPENSEDDDYDIKGNFEHLNDKEKDVVKEVLKIIGLHWKDDNQAIQQMEKFRDQKPARKIVLDDKKKLEILKLCFDCIKYVRSTQNDSKPQINRKIFRAYHKDAVMEKLLHKKPVDYSKILKKIKAKEKNDELQKLNRSEDERPIRRSLRNRSRSQGLKDKKCLKIETITQLRRNICNKNPDICLFCRYYYNWDSDKELLDSSIDIYNPKKFSDQYMTRLLESETFFYKFHDICKSQAFQVYLDQIKNTVSILVENVQQYSTIQNALKTLKELKSFRHRKLKEAIEKFKAKKNGNTIKIYIKEFFKHIYELKYKNKKN